VPISPQPSGWADLVTAGYAPLVDLVADVGEVVAAGGERVLRLRLAGGLHLDVLLDHGLDLGQAWYAGVPVAWRSPNPVDPGPWADWESRFRGGLLVTCGPDNIGEPREGRGQHGTHHGTPAHDVTWRRVERDGEIVVEVSGSVAHTSLGGPRLVVRRTIRLATGSGAVTVDDVWRNAGAAPAGIALLYHVNLGAPLLAPGGRVEVDAGDGRLTTRTREPLPEGRTALDVPGADPGHAPVVAEHRSPAWDAATATDTAVAVLTGPDGAPRASVTWTTATLPRLDTWCFPQTGTWVLGIEPANAALFGPERTRPWAGAPVLAPGEELRARVVVDVDPASPSLVPAGPAAAPTPSQEDPCTP